MWSLTLDPHEELYQSTRVRSEHLPSYGDSYGYNVSDTFPCKHYSILTYQPSALHRLDPQLPVIRPIGVPQNV